jgi:hypothetical protein
MMRDRFHWARLLSFVTGLVNQELLLRNEYLAAENRTLERICPRDSGCPMRSDLLWPRSPNDSAAKPSRISDALPSRIPSSPGIAQVRDATQLFKNGARTRSDTLIHRPFVLQLRLLAQKSAKPSA